VSQEKFIGMREFFGVKLSWRMTENPYFKGDQVKVFYEPGNPSNAVLRPLERNTIWFGFLVSTMLTFFGVFFILQLRKGKNFLTGTLKK